MRNLIIDLIEILRSFNIFFGETISYYFFLLFVPVAELPDGPEVCFRSVVVTVVLVTTKILCLPLKCSSFPQYFFNYPY